MSFVCNALYIFAQHATFLLNWWDHLAPFPALSVDVESSLLSNCLVLLQKKISYKRPLASVPHACFILVILTVNLQFIHQRFVRIAWLQFLQIYYVPSLVAHFLLLPFLYVHAMMVHAHHLNLGRWKHKINHPVIHKQCQWIKIRWLGQDWRELVVQACFGVEEAAAERISATQKLMLDKFSCWMVHSSLLMDRIFSFYI